MRHKLANGKSKRLNIYRLHFLVNLRYQIYHKITKVSSMSFIAKLGNYKVENDFLKKNVIYLCKDRRKLLEQHHPCLSLRDQCLLLGINRSSYYYKPEPIDEAMLALMKLVDETYTKHPYFGTRQMSNYLRLNGCDIDRSRIRSIYEQLGLQAACPGPHTSKPHPEHKIYPYLLRNVEVGACNQVWSTDITFLRMKKGFVYLSIGLVVMF